jgi:methylase of polypeptide subunit release factors
MSSHNAGQSPAAVLLHWQENDSPQQARWQSEAGNAPPTRVQIVDDQTRADDAFRLACAGTGMLWHGDFQSARQLLQALGRRLEQRKKDIPSDKSPSERFHRYRMAQAQRARILGMVLIPVGPAHRIALRRAPDVSAACIAAYGERDDHYVVSLRELLGVIGAYQWQSKGVFVPALSAMPTTLANPSTAAQQHDDAQARIHPHYGVFSPVRGEYIDLVAKASLPAVFSGSLAGMATPAFDIGTGTGVLAAVLARRGLQHILATDRDPRALACARDNLARLGLTAQVQVLDSALFPDNTTRAGLIVCNPPWLPGKPGSPLEHAIYDPDSRMLRSFLSGLAAHLAPGGEGWLVLSDLAEHLGLRSRDTLLQWIGEAGLQVLGRSDARPQHPKAFEKTDPLYEARRQELTSLWRLGVAQTER